MAESRLKDVHKISQKYKDIVFGYVRIAQSTLSKETPYFNIVDLIQHFILLYYYQLFESKILNDDEKDKLLNLLAENNKSIADYPWKLIFESSKDGLERQAFIDKVWDHPNILILIGLIGLPETVECVIGGYTSLGWYKSYDEEYVADKEAFVFYLKSAPNYRPFISNVKQDVGSISEAVGHDIFDKTAWACFGSTYLIYIENNMFRQQMNGEYNNYEQFKHGKPYLAGSTMYSTPDFVVEAFQIQIE